MNKKILTLCVAITLISKPTIGMVAPDVVPASQDVAVAAPSSVIEKQAPPRIASRAERITNFKCCVVNKLNERMINMPDKNVVEELEDITSGATSLDQWGWMKSRLCNQTVKKTLADLECRPAVIPHVKALRQKVANAGLPEYSAVAGSK